MQWEYIKSDRFKINRCVKALEYKQEYIRKLHAMAFKGNAEEIFLQFY